MKIAPRARGFTLIELMITVAVVGILAAIAYPAYTNQIAKGRRAECRAGLYMAMQQQERYYTQYNRYATQTFSISASSPVIRQSSGDKPEQSACWIDSTTCPTDTNLANCVRIEGNWRKKADNVTPAFSDPNGISQLSIESSGSKNCVVNGAASPNNSNCWP